MTNRNNESQGIIVLDNIYLSQHDVENFDEKMTETITFLMDAGMEVIACKSSNKQPGYIVFSYDAYTKNIFNLLEIDLEESELKDESVLVYRFDTDKILKEHIKRIFNLFRKYT